MSIIRDAIDRITELTKPTTYNIGNTTYASTELFAVDEQPHRPKAIEFSSLDGVVQAIKTEIGREEIYKPLFVSIDSHKRVEVFTTYRDDNMARDVLYTATPDLPEGYKTWSEHDDAIIMLRSRFIQNEGTEYLLGLLSRVSNDDAVTSDDNGVSQKVTATKGVALKDTYNVKGRVSLAPFRTFLEVAQPESEFILRLKQGDKEKNIPTQIGIIEADGGAWKLAAKRNIADYFREELESLIAENQVVVAE